MNISGILVIVSPQHVAASTVSLNAIPGVSIHYTDPGTGRIIVTQEAETTSAEIDGLKQIKALPNIILAELVYHYFEQEKAESNIETAEDE
jgi:nitrate reductase NapD